jgi:hypothetical protein
MPARSTRHIEPLLSGTGVLGTVGFDGSVTGGIVAQPSYNHAPQGKLAFAGSVATSFTVDIGDPPRPRGAGSIAVPPAGKIKYAGTVVSQLFGTIVYSDTQPSGTIAFTSGPFGVSSVQEGVSEALPSGVSIAFVNPFDAPTWTAIDQ